MKKIEAIIRPYQVDQVKAALDRLGIPGLTIGEVHALVPDAPAHAVDLPSDGQPKLKLEILLDDAAVDDAVASIVDVTAAGAGELFVAPVDEVVRIRTGERGAAAV